MRDGRFGRLSARSTADEIRQVLGHPEGELRARKGGWTTLWQFGAFQSGFDQDGTVVYLLLELQGLDVPPALGLDLGELRPRTTIEAFRSTAEEHGVQLRDVTPEALADGYATWLGGAGGVYAAFHVDDGLYALGVEC